MTTHARQLRHVEHSVPGSDQVWRPGSTTHAESGRDLLNYLRPLEQIHAGALHGTGIADGLDVAATAGSTTVTVGPGVAVDAEGRHIALSPGGLAELADKPDQGSDLVTVGDDGVALSTAGRSGTCVVTVAWRETFHDNVFDDTGQQIFVDDHTPWLRIVPAAEVAGTDRLVLATLTLDAAGHVTPGGVSAQGRTALALSGAALTLRSTTAAGSGVGEVPGAAVAARADGGLEIRTTAAADPPLSVNGDGRVGIGTLTVSDTLTVAGALAVAGALSCANLTATSLSTSTLTTTILTASGDVNAANLGITGTLRSDAGFLTLRGSSIWDGGDGRLQLQSGGGNTFLRGAVTVEGFTHVQGQFVAETGSWVNGPLTVGGQFVAKTDSWVNGQFVAGAATWVNGPLTVGGQFVAKTDSWVNGQFVAGAATWVNGPLTVGGQFVAKTDSWVNGQFVAGAATWVNGPLTVGGQFVTKTDSWVNGQFVAGGNSWVNGQFVVGGTTFLQGEVWVTGVLHKAGGGFMIDHPLAPGEKYLSHSFVESPDMVNLYSGVAVTDDEGRATVSLPDYFEALNREHRFQFTTIGTLALATVEGEVRDNAFTIRTDQPGVTVSWQVTGIRQDPWAEANRIVVEQEKPHEEQSRFLHPELYGHAEDPASFGPPTPQPDTGAPPLAPDPPQPVLDSAPVAPVAPAPRRPEG